MKFAGAEPSVASDAERERRASLHRQIGALEKALDAIGCAHRSHQKTRKRCVLCAHVGAEIIGAGLCLACERVLCVAHLAERTFADETERAKYFRLRSKLRRLQDDLAQGRLFSSP